MASAAVAYARTIRPFPTKRLSDVTYHVVAEANSVGDAVNRMLIDPPGTPESWCQGLQEVTRLLIGLEERCQEVRPLIDEMYEDADRSYKVAVDAMLAILRGLQATGEPDPPEVIVAAETA